MVVYSASGCLILHLTDIKTPDPKYHGALEGGQVCGLNVFSATGAAACAVQDATTEKTDPLVALVTVWPPGSNLHQGETVLLLCSVQSNSSSFGTYRWFVDAPLRDLTSGPRVSVHGGSLVIRGVSGEDQGRYWCRAEHREGNRTEEIQSQMVDLKVRDSPGPTLAMTPDSSYVFRGERFTLLCPESTGDPSDWRLRHFSLDSGVTSPDRNADHCASLGGAVTSDGTLGCMFSAGNGSSGLYWCESPVGRTSAVHITVSSASVIMRTPVSPVPEGHRVTLYCRYRTDSPGRTSFYKNGQIIHPSTTTRSNKTIMTTIDNVTREDEGFYKCKSPNVESEESWLSVQREQGKMTTADGAADVINGHDEWWIVVSCCIVLLLLIPVSVWLVWRSRHKAKCTCNGWLRDAQGVPSADLPVTKQDASEVQWDLSWMEMTNLLDKNLYPGT